MGDRTVQEDLVTAVERHRRELHVYCYRMVGSFTEAEDLVQDTVERAWRAGARPDGAVRAWLYRIATNVCIDHLRRRGRARVLPFDVLEPIGGPADLPTAPTPHLWVEPFPDRFLQDEGADPAELVVDRETVELAFIAAVQQLSLTQRVCFIARDVMGWSTRATAVLLGSSEAAVKSGLQRARAGLRGRLPDREAWVGGAAASREERRVVQRYVDAHLGGEISLADVLAEDVRIAYPAIPLWTDSREMFIQASREHAPPGEVRMVVTRANGQPAVAIFLRPPGEEDFRLVALEVLRVAGGRVVEVVDYAPEAVASAFDLRPPTG